MIAHCIHIHRSELADHQRDRFRDTEASYDLTVGHDYQILGMIIVEGVLNFLVPADHGQPAFAPAGMFDLFDSEIPPGWKFRLMPGIQPPTANASHEPIYASWGYPELIDDPDHAARLESFDPDAHEIFHRHLAEIPRAQDDDAPRDYPPGSPFSR